MKYKQIMDMTGCPPDTSCETEVQAFRFVFDEMDDNSFIPCGIKDPARRPRNNKERCSFYALSMFNSEVSAKQRFKQLKGNNPNIEKTLGNKLATGKILPEMGRSTKVSGTGHFDFFEYESCNLPECFEIVGDINEGV